jgi:penicillin-binding protein 1B
VTPVELAESYTIFANKGIHVKRSFVTSIRDRTNRLVYTQQPQGNQVLDERVAYIMTNLMEEVMRSGTAAGARGRGFTIPAAGKTGTSRDGWFAGYTSKLLTVVWIGYDDNAEFEMEAAHSARPVWVDFMKRAYKLRQYSKVSSFDAPKGIVRAEIDPETGLLAGPNCLESRSEVFIAGTQPTETCEHDEEMNPIDGEKKNIFKSVLGIFR